MGSLAEELVHAMSVINEVVKIPAYAVMGVLSGGRLLIKKQFGTAYDIYVYDDGELTKLNRGSVRELAEPPYGADRVVMIRDDGGTHSAVMVGIDDLEEVPLSPHLPQMRIYSIVDRGDRVYILGFDGAIKIFEVVPRGEVREITSLPYPGVLLGVGSEYGVGVALVNDVRTRLFIVDLAGGDTSLIEAGEVAERVVMTPDDVIIAASSTVDGIRFARISPPEWLPEPLSFDGEDLAEYEPLGIDYLGYSPEGELVVVGRKYGRTEVFIDGWRLDTPRGVHGPAYRVRDYFVLTHSSLATPPRVIKVVPGKGWEPILGPDLPHEVTESLGEAGFVWVEGADEERVPTLYLESRRARRPGPTVVLVHGGPRAHYSDSWDPEVASLAAAGFHVVIPNYRGSSGHGIAWELKLYGRVCDAEVKDVAAAADWARESGLSSEEYVMGHSFGGYVTLCAMTKYPGRFVAGVAGACFTDWEEMYDSGNPLEQAYIEMLLLLFEDRENDYGGLGEDGRRRLREASPINYVGRLRRPVCIIHSLEDERVPPHSALRFVEEGMRRGKEIEVHIVPGLSHRLGTHEELIKYLYPAISFLIRQRVRRSLRRGRALPNPLNQIKDSLTTW